MGLEWDWEGSFPRAKSMGVGRHWVTPSGATLRLEFPATGSSVITGNEIETTRGGSARNGFTQSRLDRWYVPVGSEYQWTNAGKPVLVFVDRERHDGFQRAVQRALWFARVATRAVGTRNYFGSANPPNKELRVDLTCMYYHGIGRHLFIDVAVVEPASPAMTGGARSSADACSVYGAGKLSALRNSR